MDQQVQTDLNVADQFKASRKHQSKSNKTSLFREIEGKNDTAAVDDDIFTKGLGGPITNKGA